MNPLSTVAASIAPGDIVAIDGVDGAGKTVFADRLAGLVPAAIRSSVDGRLYLRRYDPEAHASIVIDNTVPEAPVVVEVRRGR